jgi:hypothetical protein
VKILLSSSGALTIRLPVFLSQKEFIKSIFGFTNQTEPCNDLLTIVADLSMGQSSTALQISADVEAGTNAI